MRILADSSVWVDHLHGRNERLGNLLYRNEIVCHRFVIGELACGSIKRRREVLELMSDLPQILPVAHDRLLTLIDRGKLAGRGLGFVDVHLLAGAQQAEVLLWTQDKALKRVASAMGFAFEGR